ncbi:MAG: transcriptional repressor, partial [Dehalococcoidia bacterium]|nr:transcriptional repressor [Dehalococcoidia bacterium]
MRYSRQRDAILRVVRCTTCHPSAEWVYSQVKRELPNISLGTVYRN